MEITDVLDSPVKLPTTVEALDEFMDSLITEFQLPNHDDTRDAIATMVLHLPHTQAFAKRSYFGHGVYKAMANQAAYKRLEAYREKREQLKKEVESKAKLELVSGDNQDVTPAIEQPLQIS